jgi:hypothetical protein
VSGLFFMLEVILWSLERKVGQLERNALLFERKQSFTERNEGSIERKEPTSARTCNKYKNTYRKTHKKDCSTHEQSSLTILLNQPKRNTHHIMAIFPDKRLKLTCITLELKVLVVIAKHFFCDLKRYFLRCARLKNNLFITF